jgi:hypothetical protein
MTRPRSTRHDPDSDRSRGGPGSSHQGGSHGGGHAHGTRADQEGPVPGEPTNPPKSRVSGGGGERDRHHVHDERTKS